MILHSLLLDGFITCDMPASLLATDVTYSISALLSDARAGQTAGIYLVFVNERISVRGAGGSRAVQATGFLKGTYQDVQS